VAIDNFVAKGAIQDMIAVDAVLIVVEIAAVHTVFVFHGVGEEVAIFAFIDVVAELGICLLEVNHPDPWCFKLKGFVIVEEGHGGFDWVSLCYKLLYGVLFLV
jgi:hypothetical protein